MTAAPGSAGPPNGGGRRRRRKGAVSQNRVGYLFASPWLVGFVALMLLPMIAPQLMQPGEIWGGMGGTQNIMDVQRAMQYQQDLTAAQQQSVALAGEEFGRISVGLAEIFTPDALTEAQKLHIKAATQKMGEMGATRDGPAAGRLLPR